MKKDIFLVELVNYYYYDETDHENVEDRHIIGYFFDIDIMNQAIELCNDRKKESEQVVITKESIDCNYNQKFVYVLCYEYSLFDGNNYTDYYYHFEPFSNYNKCMIQKDKLLNEQKYMNDGKKIFYDSIDGFYVDKILTDTIFYINYH